MANKKKDIESTEERSYFAKRMQDLGITPEINKVALMGYNADTRENELQEESVFTEIEKGIRILVYTLTRSKITIQKPNSNIKDYFSMTRLKEPIVKADGETIKYLIPKGAGTQPFFPPALIAKFEKKEKIKNLYLVEGYFKAFKAAMHGVDIVGLSSINHMKDKETGKLHGDIKLLIESGLVERVIWLTDGDCLDISSKEISDVKDLATRPTGFFQTVVTFKNLLDGYDNLEKWFMHIDIDTIITQHKDINRDMVKGIDDLLCTFADKAQTIVDDLQRVDGHSAYFHKFNISYGTSKVYNHFHIGNVDVFFLFHSERRKELKLKEFKFHGTKYKYDEAEGKCKIMVPSEANLYFRVGDEYYKWIGIPNQYQKTERTFHQRKRSTIVEDHGKDFPRHIPKYESFCNVPNHTNYQAVINSCFNVYSPLEILPDEEQCTEADFPVILSFIKHIFGEKTVSFKEKGTNEKKEYSMLQLGLDYIQLLYQQPQLKLPILCLVSRENSTGKTTMGDFLRLMLSANVAIVGNADLANDFNAHWATKSVVICDETKIDKQNVIEKIKALSTAKKIFMNAKGRGQVELDCFIKFILITNNEENFISANEEDIRYWVIKVPRLTTENPRILDDFVEELPAFLSFLSKRTMATQYKSRMWFHPELLKTEALLRVINFSQSTIVKEIKSYMRDIFLDTGIDEILMTPDDLQKEVFQKKYERAYIHQVLTDKLKLRQLCTWHVDTLDKVYNTEEEAITAAGGRFPELQGHMILCKIKSKGKVARYTYPAYREIPKDNERATERMVISCRPGRPYVFKRLAFVSAEETADMDLGAENEQLKEILGDKKELAGYVPVSTEIPFK